MSSKKLRDFTLGEVVDVCLANPLCIGCPFISDEHHNCGIHKPWEFLKKELGREVDVDGSKR